MKNTTVLISGAGVAGLTLAYWLKKYGYSVTIVERHHEIRTWGYKLDIRGSALDVIKEMGIHEKACLLKSDTQGATMIDSFGNEVAKMDPDTCGGRIKDDIEILRADLCNLLADATSDIEYLFGDSIAHIVQDDAVSVTFESGKVRKFDLLLGADGLHSTVRREVFGEESKFLKELGMYVTYFTIPNFLQLDRWEIEYHAEQKFLIMYSSRGDKDLVAGFAFPAKIKGLEKKSAQQQKEAIKAEFSEPRWHTPQILELMDNASNFFFDTTAQTHMPSWSKGRISLVGDAAYAPAPISGQGTSLALVGAYVLAKQLAEAGVDFELAYKRYEEKMRTFVKRNQGLVDLSVSLMSDENSFLSYLHRHMSEELEERWGQLVKEINLKRIHDAATSLNLGD